MLLDFLTLVRLGRYDSPEMYTYSSTSVASPLAAVPWFPLSAKLRNIRTVRAKDTATSGLQGRQPVRTLPSAPRSLRLRSVFGLVYRFPPST